MDNIKKYTSEEVLSICPDVQEDCFKYNDSYFIPIKVKKEDLYEVPYNNQSKFPNLMTLEDWSNYDDNYDLYHTNNVENMIEYLRDGKKLAPLILDHKLGLYDGQHRLTAYSMMEEVAKIEVFKEILIKKEKGVA